jgi:hypothetical protein
MRPVETPWVTTPDGLIAKVHITSGKAAHASITIVTCQREPGFDSLTGPYGSLTAGSLTRTGRGPWQVLLCRRAADFRDCELVTARTFRDLADALGTRLREQGAWWQ